MPLLETDAIVLHGFDYLETSRIIRLATRDAGVQSVLARGAKRSMKRFAGAIDLFTGGIARISVRSGRELQTLGEFEVERPRLQLGRSLERFTAASAVVELVLRFGSDAANSGLYDVLASVLDELCDADVGRAADVGLAGAWRVVAELGFAPVTDECAACHGLIAGDAAAGFSHRLGGTICSRCVAVQRPTRTLPAAARRTLAGWLRGEGGMSLLEPERRAHQRLLREFLDQHLADGRMLRAFDVWERATWTPTAR